MNISAVKDFNNTNYINFKSYSKQEPKSTIKANYSPVPLQGHKAYNYNIISFCGNEQKLISDFVRAENSPKIYQFLCKAKNTTPIQVRKFLDYILKDDKLSEKFINEITEKPRESADTIINLTNKLGGEDKFRDWYFSSGGYRETYGKYTGNYFTKAKNVDELLNLRPNWKLSDITEVYSRSSGGDPLIGTLPKELVNNQEDFKNLVNAIKYFKNQRHGEININQDKIRYEVLKDADDKLVCKVANTNNNKNFIVKIDKNYTDPTFSRLRANSIYLEAVMGKYLSAHNCKNVPKFHFYDFFHNASLFECCEGKELEKELNPLKMNQLTPDLLSLGIRTNDTNVSNYMQTKNGTMNIDLGNASYFDALKPGDLAHTIFLPNYTGLDFSNCYSASNFAKFIKNSQK